MSPCRIPSASAAPTAPSSSKNSQPEPQAGGTLVPHALIHRELDVPPSVLRRLAVAHPERYPVLFDSAADGPLSRASVLVGQPTGAIWLDAHGRIQAEGAVPPGVVVPGEGFLRALERWAS